LKDLSCYEHYASPVKIPFSIYTYAQNGSLLTTIFMDAIFETDILMIVNSRKRAVHIDN